MFKLARLEALRQNLTAALAHHPELARAFEDALTRHDEQALGAAFEALHAGSEETRAEVEALIVEWLFGEDGTVEFGIAGAGDGSSVH
jgi:hypothetical protein